MHNLTIRPESPADIGAIHGVNAAAFGRASEADLVALLRADGALLLSLVAELPGEIVGHAAYSLVTVGEGTRALRFPALGPIAVAPRLQRRGIGAALMRAGMADMRERGYGLIFLVGHPSYYPRFGFQPALPLGFRCDYVEAEGNHAPFMVAILGERVPPGAGGRVRFHRAFDQV